MDMKTIPDSFIDEAWAVMSACPQHTFLILTKRPQRMLDAVSRLIPKYGILPNAWLGCTICNQQEADEKIPQLLQVSGHKWISIEPLLSEVNIKPYLRGFRELCQGCEFFKKQGFCYQTKIERNAVTACFDGALEDGTWAVEGIDAVVVGCETGPHRRPCNLDWIRSIVEQCKAAVVPVFVKQIEVNGKVVHELDQFPPDLRVRELPWRKNDPKT